jgi:putative restriction endonuclease
MEKVKCFTKATIMQANRIAVKRGYNRQLENKFLKSLPEDKLFPVFFTMIHEHAAGVKVDAHVRCWVAFDEHGNKAFIDCDLKLYNNLYTVEVPDEKEAAE